MLRIMGKIVWTLYRVSTKGQVTKKQNEEEDIPMQRIACQRFAEQNHWRIGRECLEKGVSGYKVSADDRDEIQKLLQAAKNHEFDILLVYKFDRIGRIEDETPFLVQTFVKLGVEVWSAIEGQRKFENHVDTLTNFIYYWQAQGESENTSIRIKTRITVTYSAARIDAAVCEIVRGIFGRTHCAPDRQSVEREYKAQILLRNAAQKTRWQEIGKIRNRLEKLQAEVANSLTGDSAFTPAQLSQAINSEQVKLEAAEAEHNDVQQSIETRRQSINAIIPIYQTFLGWAREFDGAEPPRRKMIISQLVSSVTVSRDYQIDIDFNLDYRQYCEGWRDAGTLTAAES
jgi:hypothetical protein